MAKSMASVAALPAVDDEKAWVSCGKAAKILNCSTETIRSYCRLGHLEYRTTLGGHRRVNRQQIVALKNGDRGKKVFSQKVLIYCRVSTRKQARDLELQTKRMVAYANANFKGLEQITFKEVASGFNENREKLTNLFRQILSGEHEGNILIAENRDRIARWNVGFLQLICESHNIRLLFVDQQNLSDEAQWQHDLVSFITFYSSKAYSSRTAKRKAKPPNDETMKRGIEIINSGVSFNNLCTQLNVEGYECSENQARKYIWEAAKKLGDVIKGDNSGAEYRRLFIKTDNLQARLYTDVIYEDYCRWAEKNGKIVQTKRMFGRNFHDIRAQSMTFRSGDPHANGRIAAQCYWGLEIKGKKIHYVSQDKAERVLSPIDWFLRWIDTMRGETITTRNLLDRYNKFCNENLINKLTTTELYRACDGLCNSKQASETGFLYSF